MEDHDSGYTDQNRTANESQALQDLLGKVTPSRLWLNISSESPSFASCSARSLHQGFGQNVPPKVKLCKLLGKVTPSRLWSNESFPKVKLCKLLGKVTPSRLWLKISSESQALQVARQGHSIKALVEDISESQALQVARQGHSIKALVEHTWPKVKLCKLLGKVTPSRLWLNDISESQALQVARQGHSIKALVEPMSESQALQVARQGHSIKALVEISSESQALQVARQGHSIKALVEIGAKVKLCKLLGKVTPSRLWLKILPKSSFASCSARSLHQGFG